MTSKTELRRNRILFVLYIIVVKCVGSRQDYLSSNPHCYLHLCASHLNYCDLNFNCKMSVMNCTFISWTYSERSHDSVSVKYLEQCLAHNKNSVSTISFIILLLKVIMPVQGIPLLGTKPRETLIGDMQMNIHCSIIYICEPLRNNLNVHQHKNG